MTTYFIGDIQGCFKSFMHLLDEINYNPNKDLLSLCGDIVNRGPQSKEVLEFILQHRESVQFILGNHDIYALYYLLGGEPIGKDHTLDDLINSSLKNKFLDLLLDADLMLYKPGNYAMVHAGIAPQWGLVEALEFSKLWRATISSNDPLKVVQAIWGNEPCDSEYADDPWLRLRYVVNVFTRIRFCDAKGALDFYCKMTKCNIPGFKPWFEWREGNPEEPIFFGHWAALEGVFLPGIIGLDTGCAWGGRLTAYALEKQELYSVPFLDS